MKLPTFKYHPDPIKTGNIVKNNFHCKSCNQEREYQYVGPIGSFHDDLEGSICAGCVANGLAAKKFDATFAWNLNPDIKVQPEEWKEFTERTPGYMSWQDQVWLTHCDQICEFHGDFSKEELLKRYDTLRKYARKTLNLEDTMLNDIIENYGPDNINPAFYKFVCTKCAKVLFHCDYT